MTTNLSLLFYVRKQKNYDGGEGTHLFKSDRQRQKDRICDGEAM